MCCGVELQVCRGVETERQECDVEENRKESSSYMDVNDEEQVCECNMYGEKGVTVSRNSGW